MKKILILSYFYPPCNLTAAQRVKAFAQYLPNYGFYPIIVTRRWDNPVIKLEDTIRPTNSSPIHEVYSNHEVYYEPYLGSKRDHLFFKPQTSYRIFLRRFLTILELFTQWIFPKAVPSYNLYQKCRTLIKQHDIKQIVISANPYTSFFFGYLLKKEFSHINWYADYRDDWTTKELAQSSLSRKFFKNYESFFEKKYLSNASAFICVSDLLTRRIAKLVKRPGINIANGYFEEYFTEQKKSFNPAEFIITYTGQLYAEQDFTSFLQGLRITIEKYKGKCHIMLQLIGTSLEGHLENKIKSEMQGLENHLKFVPRVPFEECLHLEKESDAFVLTAYGDLKGIPSSKLYSYVAHRKPVFLCPSDFDVIDQTLTACGIGFIAQDAKSIFEKLDEVIAKHCEGTLVSYMKEKINEDAVRGFSRKEQIKLLANLLNDTAQNLMVYP